MEEEDRLPSTLDAEIIRKQFHLQDADLREIRRCRGAANRISFAIQLSVLRWRGHFLRDVRTVPWEVWEHISQQLGILAFPLSDFVYEDETRQDHMERIRRYLGFTRCGASERQLLLEHGQITPRSSALLESALRWLAERKIVRPGRSTLLDVLQTAREQAMQRVYEKLTDVLTPEQRQCLEGLLVVQEETGHSALELFKAPAAQESADALLSLLERLKQIQALGLTDLPHLKTVHSAMQRLLATWGYRHDAWSLRRFPVAKRLAIVLCFLQVARAEIIDAIVEMQDKLLTRQHNRAKMRRQELLRATEQARSQAIEVLETLGMLVLDPDIPDADLRKRIYAQLPDEQIRTLVTGCRQLRLGGNTSHLGFLDGGYNYTRRYSPELLEVLPFTFAENAPLAEAVEHLREMNRNNRRKLSPDAPTEFLSRRWKPFVEPEPEMLSRPHYEMAMLSILNEQLKSGDVTLSGSRRWTDFDDYLLPRDDWEGKRSSHYTTLGLPQDVEVFLEGLQKRLEEATERVEKRLDKNSALTIDAEKGTFRLSPYKGEEPASTVKDLRNLLEARLPRTDLVDLLIDMDNETDFLRHFLHVGGDHSRLPPTQRRRNILAALIAVGCNIGPQRMATASPGIGFREISQIADWYFTEETLKASSVDLVNYASRLPLSRLWGTGDTCSADGMRFYVPVHILAADYSAVLGDRGVTMLAHTADNFLRLHQKPVPCRLRESTFCLDGLMEHDTELDPRVCYTDTHGFTEVVMATAALLGFELAPRLRDVKDTTLYKMDRSLKYPKLDPILTGTIQPQRIRPVWDEVVHVIASLKARCVSPSLRSASCCSVGVPGVINYSVSTGTI